MLKTSLATDVYNIDIVIPYNVVINCKFGNDNSHKAVLMPTLVTQGHKSVCMWSPSSLFLKCFPTITVNLS